jgi:uncharacterized membrane protein YadS
MSDIPPPGPSPKLPDDSAPVALEKTPAYGLVTAEYVKRKMAAESNGKPVVSKKLTPYFLAGFILCGAVTSVVVGDPDVPGWVVKAAAIGSMFFGGLLGIGPGWRK